MIRKSKGTHRFEPNGLAAIEPQAFFEIFMEPESRANELIGSIAVVDICGPLRTHDSGWSDSYEAIRARVQTALDDTAASAIVLRLDSPGGDVTGCFDCARAIKRAAAAANKPMYAFVEKACSAAYALASGSTMIGISETGVAGSIGVLATRQDFSAMNAARGMRMLFVASGARKLDGHPDSPITEAEIAATQRHVDSSAQVFFSLVEEMRGIASTAVASLDAGVFHGELAVTAGLADQVTSFELLLATIASGEANMSDWEKARAALEKTASGKDANAAAAKRALAAMDEGGGDDDKKEDDAAAETGDDDDDKKDDDKKEGDESAEAGDDDETAEDDSAPAGDDTGGKKKTGAAAPAAADSASTHSIALRALAEAHELKAQLAQGKERAERKRLLASRPDFDSDLRSELLKASTPIATVRSMVKTLKRKAPADPAAADKVTGLRGAGQGTNPTSADNAPTHTAERLEQRSRMGLTSTRLGVMREGNALKFGVIEEFIEPAAAGGGKAASK